MTEHQRKCKYYSSPISEANLKKRRNEYDVIISNFKMPRMKGDKLYLEVQKLSQDLAKRIIFISGDINDFIRSTGNRFLSKPFSHQQLIEIVKDLLKAVGESDP